MNASVPTHLPSWPRGALSAAVATAALVLAMPASAQTEIQWWHSMTSANNDRVNALAEGFNKSQSEYRVVPIYKGGYAESMTAGIAAFRAGNAPHIIQIFEVGTATMMSAKGAIVPVEKLMKDAGLKFDRQAYVPAVAGYYTTSDGQMLSFPFNSSTTVFYYNKDAFAKAGIDKVPQTWPEVAAAAGKLKASGFACAYTTSFPSWVHLESFSAWHNVPFATEQNGFGGPNARLTIDTPLHERHLNNLAQWARDGWFQYAGRGAEGDSKFASGECAMGTASSAAYANIKRNAEFDFGIARLPYYSDVQGAPQNTVIGGASLWVMAGRPAAEYKGVARFFEFLSSPENQAAWHQGTGYLPLTLAAYELTKQSGFYEKNPGTDISVEQMIVKTTDKSRGIRLGNFLQIRDVNHEEMESLFAGKQTAKQALQKMTTRGNDLLARFERTARN
ncbi:MAG TPA: sn-glycerol-3-phosphate ABC transporter substrate-binding protein UgpB [Burkholderiaceae bacterium]|nr:sn-glycerol-3-phosphate ABC transporter substrate-binding protein UgpB [Burkholderiaceae bacterium]